jgi:hypothetical protein
MDLDNKYALGQVAANDSESKTFRATEIATGREVLVHLLFGGKPAGGGESLLSILMRRVTDATPDKRAPILEISDYKGMPYAVTEVLEGFQGMRAWIEKGGTVKAGVWKVPGAAPPSPAAPSTPEDEFEKLFGSAQPAAEPPRPAPAPPPVPPAAGGRHEGEFTKLFRSTIGGPAVPPAPPAVAPRPTAPAVVPSAPPPPPAQGPGEFTRMFQASPPPEAAQMPEMPAAPPAPPFAPSGPEHGPGEFTRMFQSPSAAGAPPPAMAPPQPPSGCSSRRLRLRPRLPTRCRRPSKRLRRGARRANSPNSSAPQEPWVVLRRLLQPFRPRSRRGPRESSRHRAPRLRRARRHPVPANTRGFSGRTPVTRRPMWDLRRRPLRRLLPWLRPRRPPRRQNRRAPFFPS